MARGEVMVAAADVRFSERDVLVCIFLWCVYLCHVVFIYFCLDLLIWKVLYIKRE